MLELLVHEKIKWLKKYFKYVFCTNQFVLFGIVTLYDRYDALL